MALTEMIDLLSKKTHSSQQIKLFFSKVFECKSDQVKVFSLNEFNSLNEYIDSDDLCCICVCSDTKGDASQLIQIYRYKMTDSELIKKIILVASNSKEIFYIPNDLFSQWLVIGAFDKPKMVKKIEHEDEDFFCFE